MSFPTNGRVVVIDDDLEEAGPLLEALSRHGIAARYFSGRARGLPEKPLNGVRLVFLDMMLEGMDFTTDSEDVVNQLRAVFGRLIDDENGPYIVFAWTKNPKHLAVFEARISPKPVLCLDMEKSDCIADGKCDISAIEKKLEENLPKIGSDRILFDWENLVNDSGFSVVNQIIETSAPPGSVDSTLFHIAQANLGKRGESASPPELTKAALQIFNTLLSDTANVRLCAADLTCAIKRDETPLSAEAMGKINSKVLLGTVTESLGYPGNVYVEQLPENKKSYTAFLNERISLDKAAKFFRKKRQDAEDDTYRKASPEAKQKIIEADTQQFKSDLSKVPLVFIEISPVCDHAQGTAKYHRILPGFLLPHDLTFALIPLPNDIAIYTSPFLYIEQLKFIFSLNLDLRGMKTISLHALEGAKPLFRVSEPLLFDIQHKVGAQFRPGIFLLA
jgi:hypothetical protein